MGAVLRRRSRAQDGPRRVGDLIVDPLRRQVTVGEREVPLTKKEFDLLRVLASDPTRVFTKEELLDRVWAYKGPSKTRTLDSHASRLRRRLDPEEGRFVINCWGIGYRLVAG
jgi:DNA-binding response OmpR family regulator